MNQILIAIDQLFNTFLGGWADETFSARCYRKNWKRLVLMIDGIFFWQKNHCRESFQWEKDRMDLPSNTDNLYRNQPDSQIKMTIYKIPLIVSKKDGKQVAVLVLNQSRNGGGIADTVAWKNITEKPETFPSSVHTHTASEITDFDEKIAEFFEDGEITVTAKSAYPSWLEQPGNENKTEAEFIESLKVIKETKETRAKKAIRRT